jgi:phosphoribosylformylglycinamidine synthase I
MAKVNVLVLRAPGANCDKETAFAFEKAEAVAELIHVNRLINREKRLADYQILVIPGGFTYGDDIAAGRILANEMKLKLGDDTQKFIKSGGLILGICNGFQVLAKAGLFGDLTSEGLPAFTLTDNDSGRFECRWIKMVANKKSNCVFTRGIERMYLPVAHGEGKLVAEPKVLAKLNVALRYCDDNGKPTMTYPANPNGSMDSIAGIADKTGRVFALMPHPERYIRGTQHPLWPRLGIPENGDGFAIFTNAVKWVKSL